MKTSATRREFHRTGILYTPEDKVIKKPNNRAINQYLKVLKPIYWDQCPSFIGCPYDVRPTRENTFMVDNNASKNILNPTSNFIVCPTWTDEKVQDRILLDLTAYLQVLWSCGLPMNQFIRSNPIGKRYMDLRDYLYKELFSHAKFNKLIWERTCACPSYRYVSYVCRFSHAPYPFPLRFCLFYFGTSVWSPRLRLLVTQTWEVLSMRPLMMPHPPLTTPKSLLMPASLIAPTQANIPTICLHHHSKAQSATVFRHPPLGPVAVLHPNGGCGWTLGLERVDPSTFLCVTHCPSKPIRTQAPLVPRWSPTSITILLP